METKASVMGDMTEDQIKKRVKEETRRGEDVEAYKWTHETPDRVMTAEEVWDMCCKIRRRFQEYIERPFDAGQPVPTDEAIKDQLLREDPEIAQFARSNDHKGTFEVVACRTTGVEHLTKIAMLLHILDAKDKRYVTSQEATELSHRYLKGLNEPDQVDAFIQARKAAKERRKHHKPSESLAKFRGKK